MTMRLTWFITTLTNPVSRPFLENDHFFTSITQSETLDQGQAPSHAAKTRRCSQKWYQNLGTKDDMFTAIWNTRLTGYSDAV